MAVGGIARSLARLYYPQWIRAGWGANAMVRQARTLGLSYRRTIMLGDIREFTGLMRREKAVRAVVRSVLPSRSVMVETELRRARRYRVFGDVTYRNRLTGEEFTQTVSFYDDELRSLDQWEEEYERQKEEAEYREDLEIVKVDFRAIEHNRGFRY